MILLRHKEQKEYSAALTKLIAGAKTVANKAMTKIDNAGLATQIRHYKIQFEVVGVH